MLVAQSNTTHGPRGRVHTDTEGASLPANLSGPRTAKVWSL